MLITFCFVRHRLARWYLFVSLQLLKMGFVDKANFDSEERDRYERERRENSVIKERQEVEAKQREENAKAYEEWIAQKEMRDSALKCLALVPKPVAEMPVAHDDPRGSATSLRRSQQQPTTTALGKTPIIFLACSYPACLPTIIVLPFLSLVAVLCRLHQPHAEPRFVAALSGRGARHEEGGPDHLPGLGQVVRRRVQH